VRRDAGLVLGNVMTRAEVCRGALSYGDKGRFGHLRCIIYDTNVVQTADCYKIVVLLMHAYESSGIADDSKLGTASTLNHT
jgi:hypothetical protein